MNKTIQQDQMGRKERYCVEQEKGNTKQKITGQLASKYSFNSNKLI